MSEYGEDHEGEVSWIDIGNARHIREALERRVANEHQQIATRIGWLVTSNSFLFAPVAILYSNGPSRVEELLLIWLACFLGLAMSLITFKNVDYALVTMDKAKEYEKAFQDYIIHREDRRKFYEFLFVDLDVDPEDLKPYAINEDVDWWPEKRSENIHPWSMRLQTFIPLLLCFVWLIIGMMSLNTELVATTDLDSQSQSAVMSKAFPQPSPEDLAKASSDLRRQLGTLQASLSNTEEPLNQSHKMKKPVSEGN